MSKFRFAVVTDIHNGPNIGHKRGEEAISLTQRFINAANKFKAALTIDMGDRISALSLDEDRANMRSIRREFNALASPYYSVNGNHDVRHVTNAEAEEITGNPAGNYSLDDGGVHFVFLNPGYRNYIEKHMSIPQSDLEWLKEDLARTELPTIVISHVPLDNIKTDNYEGDNPGKRVYYRNGADARAILEESGKVVLCMAGHVHRNSHRIHNDIHYIRLQSLVQERDGKRARVPFGAFALIKADAEEGTIDIRVKGKYDKRYELTFQPAGPKPE